MSEESSEDDKQFDATPKKLEEARKKGEVPRSVDLSTAAAYAGLIIAAAAFGPGALTQLGEMMQTVLDQSDALARESMATAPTPWIGGMIWATVIWTSPFFAVPAALVILATVAQQAFLVTPSKVAFKANRISLIQGFKNKFGRNGLFEFAKSFSKLLIYSVLLGIFLWGRRHDVFESMFMSPGQATAVLLRLVVTLLLLVFVISILIGLVDFLWQRAEHLRKNRMSRKEVMDELKNSEGDPLMKNQRRQKAVDLAMNKMLTEVPDASVVIVNPTHYAVALKWIPGEHLAPVCVAKGVDEIAARIRETAQAHGVPIQSDPPTARALYATTRLDQEISSEHFKAVAAAIRYADSIRRKARAMT